MKKYIILALLVTGCASEHKMSQISAPLEEKGKVSSTETLGLNDSGEAIIQEKERADQELRGLVWQNNESEQEVNSLWHELKRCREESADSRLGGSGEVVELPEIDNMKPTIEVKEKIGLINSEIMVVKETYYKDRVKMEKQYGQSLSSMEKIIKKNKVKCEYSLAQKRVKAGLPSQRTQGKFKISADGKLEGIVQKHEKNLDDAFEIKKRAPASEETSEESEPLE